MIGSLKPYCYTESWDIFKTFVNKSTSDATSNIKSTIHSGKDWWLEKLKWDISYRRINTAGIIESNISFKCVEKLRVF